MVHRGMARPYPGDFRERVLEARRAGASAGEIAQILRVSPPHHLSVGSPASLGGVVGSPAEVRSTALLDGVGS